MSMLQVVCLLFPLTITIVFAQSCSSIGSLSGCACRLEDSGKVIDLSSIGSKDGTPSFRFIFTDDGTCSYNPCYPYTSDFSPDTCDNVAGCVMLRDGDFYSLGTQESAYFTTNSGNVAIHYFDRASGRGMLVTLICQQDTTDPEITSQGLQGNTYQFQLMTRCACGDGCYDSSSKNDGDHVGIVGIILLLLLIFGFALYFGIGITWRKTKHDAEGWDVIPNKEFWQDLPRLVKDGCVLTVQPVIYVVKRVRGENEEKNPIVDKENEQSPYNYGT